MRCHNPDHELPWGIGRGNEIEMQLTDLLTAIVAMDGVRLLGLTHRETHRVKRWVSLCVSPTDKR